MDYKRHDESLTKIFPKPLSMSTPSAFIGLVKLLLIFEARLLAWSLTSHSSYPAAAIWNKKIAANTIYCGINISRNNNFKSLSSYALVHNNHNLGLQLSSHVIQPNKHNKDNK